MTYAKHVRAGIVGAVLAVVFWLLVLTVPAVLTVVRAKRDGGVGSASVTIDANRLLIAAAVGFTAGLVLARSTPRDADCFKNLPADPPES